MAKVGPANMDQIAVTKHNEISQPPPPYTEEPLRYVYKETPENPSPTVFQQASGEYDHHLSNTIISFPEIINNSDTGTLVKNMEFSDKTIRLGFIRKVYSIVLVQLVITGLIILGFMQFPGTLYSRKHLPFVLCPPIVVYFTTFIAMLCFEDSRKKVPYNYIFLLLFTMSLASLVGIIATLYQYKEILLAAGITFAMVLAFTLFAFQTKLDFTILTGTCLSILLALMLLGIAVLTTSYGRMRLLYTTLGIVFISFYIVCDTQMIVGGEHRYSISPEEYVFAALILYTDVIYLFLRILRMIR